MTTKYKTTTVVKQLTGSKKHNVYLNTGNTYTATTGWSGGSHSSYSLFNFKTNKTQDVVGLGNQFNAQSQSTELPIDCILIVTGIFCGKAMTPTIQCREEQRQEVKEYLGITE
jgi:hypothetical protein